MSRWAALESNPVSMTNWARAVGMSDALQFHDVWSLDSEMLAFVPQPTLAAR